jgi:hypothetical protein
MRRSVRSIEEGRGTALLLALVLVLVAVATVLTVQHPPSQVGIAVAFALFMTIGELFRVTLPGGREAAPIGVAAALAYALLGMFDGQLTTQTVWNVIALTALSCLLGALPHVAAGRALRLDAVARRVLSVGLAAAVFRPLVDEGGRFIRLIDGHHNSLLALVMLAVVAVSGLFDTLVAAFVRADRDRAPFGVSFRSELVALFGLSSAIGATGALIALAAQIMGFWAIPVFIGPLMLTQFAFRRYARVRQTYDQTVRSLSRVTEVAGYTETGHSTRVDELAVAVGLELGMSDAELEDLRYAALMHDLGQLSLDEPIPGGATLFISHDAQRAIAERGAQVIRQTGVLDRVADIVEHQADPYRHPHESVDATVPVASRIIRAVNDYDDTVGDARESSRRLEALERLRLSMAYDYDPRVVDTLARVVERNQRLGF